MAGKDGTDNAPEGPKGGHKGKDQGLFERPPGSGVWYVLWYDKDGVRHR